VSSSRAHWLTVYEIKKDDLHLTFATGQIEDRIWGFYVPAAPGEAGASVAREPEYEATGEPRSMSEVICRGRRPIRNGPAVLLFFASCMASKLMLSESPIVAYLFAAFAAATTDMKVFA
jgi:hypothetical protein